MPHEGTFYPVWLLQEFLSVISTNTSEFRPHVLLNASQCAFPRSEKGTLECMYEELLLPTYLWQHYPTLAATQSSPPLALRPVLWQKKWSSGRLVPVTEKVNLTAATQAFFNNLNTTSFLEPRPHVCAIKISKCPEADMVIFRRLRDIFARPYRHPFSGARSWASDPPK